MGWRWNDHGGTGCRFCWPGFGGWHKKAAEIVQFCFAPSFLTLSSSLCLSGFLSPALSACGADHARTAAAVTGARLLFVASCFVFLRPSSASGAGRLCFLCLSFLPLSVCLSVPLVLGAMRSRQAGAALRGMGGGWFDASRPDDPDCMVCMVCTTSDARFCIVWLWAICSKMHSFTLAGLVILYSVILQFPIAF